MSTMSLYMCYIFIKNVHVESVLHNHCSFRDIYEVRVSLQTEYVKRCIDIATIAKHTQWVSTMTKIFWLFVWIIWTKSFWELSVWSIWTFHKSVSSLNTCLINRMILIGAMRCQNITIMSVCGVDVTGLVCLSSDMILILQIMQWSVYPKCLFQHESRKSLAPTEHNRHQNFPLALYLPIYADEY